MTLIAQEVETETQDDNKQFELFEVVDMEDLDGNVFQTKKPIGTYSKAQLEQENVYLNQQIISVQNQIDLNNEKLNLMK